MRPEKEIEMTISAMPTAIMVLLPMSPPVAAMPVPAAGAAGPIGYMTYLLHCNGVDERWSLTFST